MPAAASRGRPRCAGRRRGTGCPSTRVPAARRPAAAGRGSAVELVARGAEQQRYVVSVHGQSVGDGHRQDVVADERAEGEQVVAAARPAGRGRPAGSAPRARPANPARVGGTPSRSPSRPRKPRCSVPLRRTPPDRLTARWKRPLPGGRGEQCEHRRASGRLPGDGDPVRITAERGDVLPHPVEGEQQVAQPEVGGDVVQDGEPVHAEPVADGDADDAVAGEGTAVVPGAGRAAREEAAAVDPHQHREGPAVVVLVGGDDAEVQHVVARHRRFRDRGRGEQRHPLGGGPVPGRVVRLPEPAARHGRGEPPCADGGFGEGDAEEAPYLTAAKADDRAGGSVHGDRLARGVEGVHHAHRIPVPEMPCTKYRCRNRKSTSTGSITTMAPASIRP